MHHPGPPRFTHVGGSVDLAPRAPDPEATYTWRVLDRPAGSEASVGETPVVHLTPDVAGTYRLELDAPDGSHVQTVRAFSDPRRTVTFRVGEGDVVGDPAGAEGVTVLGPFNGFDMATDRATESENGWTFRTRLPPGEHHATFAFGGRFDAYANDSVVVPGPGRPRLRLDGRVADGEAVVTATAHAAPDGDDPVVEFHLDDRDGLSRDDVSVAGRELRVPLDALCGRVRVHAVPVAERHGVADTLVLTPGGGFERPADPPAWVHDATAYEVFVRAFCGERVETTFRELERRVPYLESLGIDTLWLTPVVAGPERHGYHVTDLFETAADLGTRAEFESLVAACHGAGIRVLFDLVVNHTARDHPTFQLHRAGVEGYEDHYARVPRERDPSDVNWAGEDAPGFRFNWDSIPDLNYDSLAVRAWILEVVDHWAPLVDGFRCDVAWGVPHGFWQEVRERVKARNAEFLLLDETVPNRPEMAENAFDCHHDTDLYEALRAIGRGDAPAASLFEALAAPRERGFPDRAAFLRYVENHDEERYATECDAGTLRAAAAATFTLPGLPMVYYGQERGVRESRGPMRWHDGDADLTAFHRRLVACRKAHPALRAAGVERVPLTVEAGDPERVVAYERADRDERLLVVLNFGSVPARVVPDRAVGGVDHLSGEAIEAEGPLHVGTAVVVDVEV